MTDQISVGQTGDIFIDDFVKNSVARALGLEKYGDIKKNMHSIERLIQWAQKKGSSDATDVVWSIKQLANRIGSPKLGNNWAQHLSQYAYLELERMKIDSELKGMEPEVATKEDGKETSTT